MEIVPLTRAKTLFLSPRKYYSTKNSLSPFIKCFPPGQLNLTYARSIVCYSPMLLLHRRFRAILGPENRFVLKHLETDGTPQLSDLLASSHFTRPPTSEYELKVSKGRKSSYLLRTLNKGTRKKATKPYSFFE